VKVEIRIDDGKQIYYMENVVEIIINPIN